VSDPFAVISSERVLVADGRAAIGFSGTVFDKVFGGRGSVVVGGDLEGKLCAQSRVCVLTGVGLETDSSVTFQISPNSNFKEGEDVLTTGAFVKGGSGPVGGVFVSSDGVIVIDIGAGGGAAGGLSGCMVTTKCIGGDE